MNQGNQQPNQMGTEPPPMNPSDLSAAFQMIMNELSQLRSAVSAQDERLETLRAELHTPLPSTINTSNPELPASLPAPPLPPTQLTKSERLPDPEKFTGKRNELRPFLAQLKNKLEGNADRYPSERERLRYGLSRVAGDAALTVKPFNPTSLAALVEILEASYGDPNRQATAQQ